MIFAAGLGTRQKPLTDTMPKALVTVGGKPLIWHVVMKLKAAGCAHCSPLEQKTVYTRVKLSNEIQR